MTSLDGRTYDDRIRASGYNPWICDEVVDYCAFDNFVDPDTAGNAILKSLMNNRSHILLDPNLQDIGIGVSAGHFFIDGSVDNIYIVTLDFGTMQPSYRFPGSANDSGYNNIVEFYGINLSGECMHGYAICRRNWSIDPCDWNSYCLTGWEWSESDFYTVPMQNCGWCGH